MKSAFKFAFSLLLIAATNSFAAAAAQRPNIVVIMADDLGYGDLGCYGATKIKTPHCDRLAKEGRRFTDAHSPSAVCSPTRFGLLTGGYPWRGNRVPRHLLASEPLVIRDGEPTIASLLKTVGYATGCVGKWHLGAQRQNPIDWNAPLTPGPNSVGFDYFFGAINSHNQAPYVLVENDRILGLTPGDKIVVEGNQKQTSGPKLRDENALEAQQAAKAVEFIERNRDKPFFLYYPTAAVHDPLTPGKAWQKTSGSGVHGDYVQEFDWAVGEVLAALDRLKLADNTIVVVTSDNGGLVGRGKPFGHAVCGPLRDGKGTIWEGGHRVCYLVRWPGKVPAGTECAETICHVDLMATLCATLELPLPDNAGPDSFNVLPAWLGESPDKPLREATVCVSQNAAMFSLRQGPWKLVVGGRPASAENAKVAEGEPQSQRTRKQPDAPQLYNIGTDLAERDDLAATEPTKVAELSKLLSKVSQARLQPPRLRGEGALVAVRPPV